MKRWVRRERVLIFLVIGMLTNIRGRETYYNDCCEQKCRTFRSLYKTSDYPGSRPDLLSIRQLSDVIGPALLVISPGRSGSSFICDVLSSHFRGMSGEELLGKSGIQQARLDHPPLYTLQQQLTALRFLNKNDCPFVGGKWKPYNWSSGYVEALQWTKTANIPVVLSYRNILDECISRVAHNMHAVPRQCLNNGKEEKLRGCLRRAHSRVTIDLDLLERQLQAADMVRQETSRAIREADVQPLTMRYEDWAVGAEDQRIAAVQRVVSQLAERLHLAAPNVTAASIASQYTRTTPDRQSDRVRNYGEMVARLRGTPYEVYIH
mmetsp:Transcript_33266/g.93272  ORF Transcript_33266/g.93272 Transcript_33266/m.93272 type:complete len:321 (+) Transcript_33266:100-1062(+)